MPIAVFVALWRLVPVGYKIAWPHLGECLLGRHFCTTKHGQFHTYISILDIDPETIHLIGRRELWRDGDYADEWTSGRVLNKHTFAPGPLIKIFVNNTPSKEIGTSITHNFMVSLFDDKLFANAGRDKCHDIDYIPGHDEGMYMFNSGRLRENAYHFSGEKLIITKLTGAPQTHHGSNECFSSILKARDEFYIYARYNLMFGERKSQVFVSDDLMNWRLYGIVLLILDGVPMKDYSIYHMTVMYHECSKKFYGLARLSLQPKNQETWDDSYGLYAVHSRDGYRFHLQTPKLLGPNYWPASGTFVRGPNTFLMAHEQNGHARLIQVEPKTLRTDTGMSADIVPGEVELLSSWNSFDFFL